MDQAVPEGPRGALDGDLRGAGDRRGLSGSLAVRPPWVSDGGLWNSSTHRRPAPGRHRDRLPDRVAPRHRRRHPHRPRRRHRRGTGAGRPGRGAGAVAAGRGARTTRAPGSWPPPSTARSISCAAGSGTRASWRRSAVTWRHDHPLRGTRRPGRHRRRPAAPRLHRLPPRPLRRGPHRAHPAAARRPDHRRDRPRLPRPGGDGRPAHRARQTDTRRRRASPSRCRTARSARPVSARSSKSSTSSSTRVTRPPRATTGCAPRLCEDALRLARVLAELMPKEPEVHGLAALLELQTSRAAARTGPSGEPVLLKDQNRRRWNRMLIRRGFAALGRANAVVHAAAPARTPSRPPSPRATRRRTRTRTRTGVGSPPCTACSPPGPRPPSSS